MSLLHPGTGESISLAVRTSMLNEYRNAAGKLRAFEVRREYTSFGVLCSTLAKHAGAEFPDFTGTTWYPRPARFRFNGHLFQVAIPYTDYWIGPIAPGDTHSSLVELLDVVRNTVLRHRMLLLRTHYVSTV
jgi:hypothetical protein